jgi:beta-lactam-binding protein with PASTA domain
VIRQRPAAGEEAPRQATVTLTVSRGPRPVTVPAVIGQTEVQAGAALRKAGLRPNVVRVPAREPRGTVIDQNPRASARAARGSTVRINVSEGSPAPTSTQTVPTAGRATVPNVLGRRDTDAIASLQSAGFRVSSTSVSSPQSAGIVLTQSPRGGTVAARGSTVRITVSGGPGVRTVPSVVGETEAEGRRILRDAGFTVRALDRAVTDPAREGIVVEQDPRPRTRVQGTTEVLIYVGRLA